MALVQCPDCGKEFSDSAKQCPNCGYRYSKQSSQERNNAKQGVLIGIIGISLVVLSLIFTMFFSLDNWFLSIIISIIGIVLLYWAGVKLKKKYKNAIIYSVSISLLVLIILVTFIPVSDYDRNESNSFNGNREIVQLSETNQAQLEAEKASAVKFEDLDFDDPNHMSLLAGTYELTDKINFTWVIELNPDKTAVVYRKDSSDIKCYASWRKSKYDDYASLSFSGGTPRIYFGYEYETPHWPEFNDEWIYYSSTASDAKNPELRLNIRKIK